MFAIHSVDDTVKCLIAALHRVDFPPVALEGHLDCLLRATHPSFAATAFTVYRCDCNSTSWLVAIFHSRCSIAFHRAVSLKVPIYTCDGPGAGKRGISLGNEQPDHLNISVLLRQSVPTASRMWAVRNGIHRLRYCAWRAHSFYPGRRKTAPIWTGLSTSP